MGEEQYMAALGRANEVRLARAGLKRAVREGRLTLPQALTLARSNEALRGIRLDAVMKAQRRWGPERTRRELRRRGFADTAGYKSVGELTEREMGRFDTP